MEENKKKSLSEKELIEVMGGKGSSTSSRKSEYKCRYCDETFNDAYKCAEHEKNCPERPGYIVGATGDNMLIS